MNTMNKKFALTSVVVAVVQMLTTIPVWADEDEAQALKTPQNTLEVGASTSSSIIDS